MPAPGRDRSGTANEHRVAHDVDQLDSGDPGLGSSVGDQQARGVFVDALRDGSETANDGLSARAVLDVFATLGDRQQPAG